MIALLAVTLSAAPAAPAEPVALTYDAPADAKQRALKDYEFNAWDVGQTLWAASDEINVRSQPAASGASVGTLPFGAPVHVTQVGDVAKVNDRVDRWYRVEGSAGDGRKLAGWVFGGALTPLRFAADFDGDGEEELATVSFGWDFKVRVRVFEPHVTGEGRVSTFELEPAGRSYLGAAGGRVTAVLLPAKKAGMTLLQLDSRPEACSDFWTTYLGYSVPGAKPATGGKLEPALALTGMVDPPVSQTYEVAFHPAKHEAVVTTTSDGNADDENAKTPVDVTQETYALNGAKFVKTHESKRKVRRKR